MARVASAWGMTAKMRMGLAQRSQRRMSMAKTRRSRLAQSS